MTDDVLSAPAMALYERLLTAGTLPLDPGAIAADPAVEELLATGFAALTDGESPQLAPVAPVDAFEGVLTKLQAEFLAQQRQLLDAYTYLDGLQQRFLESQPMSDADALADIRTDEGAYAELAGELTAAARSEILCWNLPLQEVLANHRAALRPAATRARTVYDTGFLQRHGGPAVLRPARAAGEELRIADELPSSMLIADTTAVLLPLSGTLLGALPGALPGTLPGALLIRSELVVNAMREFFELMWQRCVPWVDREADGELLSPVQRQIVALMAVGHSDEDIAGHLGVSLRTVRRHVSDAMERLGASTRFAAGIAAAQAGLLEDAEFGDT